MSSSSSFASSSSSKRRLSYFDMDKQKVRSRVFNQVEIAAANEVFRTLEDILIDYDYKMTGKWISSGKCGCGTHQDTYFMVEVEAPIEMDIIHEIEDALEDRDVELTYVMASGHKDSIQLAIIQKYVPQESSQSLLSSGSGQVPKE